MFGILVILNCYLGLISYQSRFFLFMDCADVRGPVATNGAFRYKVSLYTQYLRIKTTCLRPCTMCVWVCSKFTESKFLSFLFFVFIIWENLIAGSQQVRSATVQLRLSLAPSNQVSPGAFQKQNVFFRLYLFSFICDIMNSSWVAALLVATR